MNLNEALKILEKLHTNSSSDLPFCVFSYISKITPLINVDLLIKDEKGRTLLSWRNDDFAGTGWHIPGGVIRFKETFDIRIKKVAEQEIGAKVSYDPVPLTVVEMIHPTRAFRGHAISLLYRCFLSGSFVPGNKGLSRKDNGYLRWHDKCPANLIISHKQEYKTFIEGAL